MVSSTVSSRSREKVLGGLRIGRILFTAIGGNSGYIHIRRNARKVQLRARLQGIGRRLTGCPSERRVGMSRGGAWKAPPRFGRLSPLALALVAGLLEFVYDGGIGE